MKNSFWAYVGGDHADLQRGIWGEKIDPPQRQYFETTLHYAKLTFPDIPTQKCPAPHAKKNDVLGVRKAIYV